MGDTAGRQLLQPLDAPLLTVPSNGVRVTATTRLAAGIHGTSCARCYRGKTGCDKARPCGRCVRTGHAQECVDRTPRPAGTSQFTTMTTSTSMDPSHYLSSTPFLSRSDWRAPQSLPPSSRTFPPEAESMVYDGIVSNAGIHGENPSLQLRSPMTPVQLTGSAEWFDTAPQTQPQSQRWFETQQQQQQQQPQQQLTHQSTAAPSWQTPSLLALTPSELRRDASQLSAWAGLMADSATPERRTPVLTSQTQQSQPPPQLFRGVPLSSTESASEAVQRPAASSAQSSAHSASSSIPLIPPPLTNGNATTDTEPRALRDLGHVVAAQHAALDSVRTFRRQLERREVGARRLKYYFAQMSEVLSAEDFQHFTRKLRIQIPLSCRAPYSMLQMASAAARGSNCNGERVDQLVVDFSWLHAPTVAMSDEASTHLASPLAILRLERLSPFLEEPNLFLARKRKAAEARKGSATALDHAKAAVAVSLEQSRKRKRPHSHAHKGTDNGTDASTTSSTTLSPNVVDAPSAAGPSASTAVPSHSPLSNSDSDSDSGPSNEDSNLLGSSARVSGCSGPLTFPRLTKFHLDSCEHSRKAGHQFVDDEGLPLTPAAPPAPYFAATANGEASATGDDLGIGVRNPTDSLFVAPPASSLPPSDRCACPPMQEVCMSIHINAEMERLIGYTQDELRSLAIKDGSRAMNKFTRCDSMEDYLRARAEGFIDSRSDYRYMHVIRNKWGAEILCLARVHIIYDDSHTLLESIHSFTPMPDTKPPPSRQ